MSKTKITAAFTYTDQELLDLWRSADAAVSLGQSYQVGDRTLTRADAEEITEKITFYESRVNAASGMAVNLARMK